MLNPWESGLPLAEWPVCLWAYLGRMVPFILVQGVVWRGIFVAAWGLLFVSSIDNVLRPHLLGKTSNLPVVLAFFGFIGGILGFGFIGVFLGLTLLAIGYALLLEWNAAEVEERRHPRRRLRLRTEARPPFSARFIVAVQSSFRITVRHKSYHVANDKELQLFI